MSLIPVNVGDAHVAAHNAERSTINSAVASSPVSVLSFGAKGDGVTDDTAAINSAIAALVAIAPFDGSGRSTKLPILFFPAGRYRIRSGLTAVAAAKLHILGAGENASQIWYDPISDVAAAVIFDFGTFTTTPTDLFAGLQDVMIEDIGIQHASPSAAGSRKGQAIRVSGGGGLTLRDVVIGGFKYGVNSPYGGDFNYYDHTTVEYCDVGYYLGPGAQQVRGDFLNAFGCVEGLVADRCAHLHLSMPVFNSCATSGITLEAITDATTRQLVSFPTGATSYSSKIVIDAPWFESNAGGLGDAYTATHYILGSNGGSDSYRNVEINNPYIVGGGPTKTTTSLIGSISGPPPQNVRIIRPVLRGALTNWIYGLANATIEDPYTTSGYIAPALANSGTTSWMSKYRSGAAEDTVQTRLFPITQKFEQDDHNHGVSIEYALNGIMRLGFQTGGSWIAPRLGFDIQNSRVYFGDPSTAASPSISSAASIPTTGSYGRGSFVHNTAPTITAGKVLLGWLRLTTGSAHVSGTDWTPFWGTTS